MSIKDNGKENSQSAKVLQLGFNISVSGDPGTDFQIVLDDEGQKRVQSSQNDICLPLSGILPIKSSELDTSKKELETDNQEVESAHDSSTKLKSPKESSLKFAQRSDSSSSKESNIINEIKSTLEHFEKFSDHFRDAPRLRTSTPVSDKNIYKSDSNLLYPEFRPKRFSHLYDYHYKKNYYFNRPSKPPDLFLKPLPGENLYRSGCYSRYKSASIRQYVSDSSLNKTSDYKPDYEKFKYYDLSSDIPGILKKFDGENGDKQSTSSGESTKDIKIYQSGGILIMQNFKENMDGFEKSEISNFNAQLIERLNVLRDETTQKGNKKGSGFPSEEGRNSGKMVQFDLSGFESQKSKSGDSSFSASKDEKSPNKQGSSESVSDFVKNKDSSPQGISQCQDFPSLSTIENESTISNQLGLSPTYSSTKKLEWDSGADVGYYNSDPSKENLSTIEKYVLSNLSSNLLDESSLGSELSKFTHVKMASDKLMNEIREERRQERREFFEKRNKEKIDKRNKELSDNEVVQNTEAGSSREASKPEILVKESFIGNPIQSQGKERKSIESIDKSVNVNTLFENADLNIENKNINSEAFQKLRIPKDNKKSHRKPSPKARKYRKSHPSPRKITWAPKKRTSLSPCKTHELPIVGMGVPKKTYKKVEGNPEIRDVELSREVEEIIIDQRFKIKQNVSLAKEIKKPNEDNEEKETKPKRPVSGSSSSNNTVLPNIESKETEKKDANKFSNQIIQTVGLDCESVGIQAFESQKSSACNSKKEEQPKLPEKPLTVQLSSKNTQAFGLNASLPKQLAHPKQAIFLKNKLTKSTQFFGERNNSLPRRFASPGLIASVRIPGQPAYMSVTEYLNSLKTSEDEVIRLNEENKKINEGNNSPKTNSKKSSSGKNKENLSSENSRKSQSQKTKSTPEKKDSDKSNKKSSPTIEDPEYVHTSDEVSSKVLTSEVLKEHGDSIDRNIIQEKYFQSQLIELKKKEMVSRSTSIDSQIEGGRQGEKECVTVGCQYSSCSKDSTSKSKDASEDNADEEELKEKGQRTETTDQYDSSQNIMEEGGNSKSTNQEQVTGDSLPSSTQTANSWVAAVENQEQDKSGVGRATSFEYLPGHIYESSGNLKELESETEQNLTTSCTSESNSGKVSTNKGGKNSEGRRTLIIENSTDNSHDSDQLKILDENLTQLNLIVSKLWEKEAQVKNLNESLFLKLCHRNGSGDLGYTDSLQTEVLYKENLAKHGNGRGDCGYPQIGQKTLQEISTACQTDDKSSSDPEKFYNERKALEKRISEEKESQIKWIENEIRHLNILRGLLEKQSLSHQGKKRHSLASDTLSRDSKIDLKTSNENYPQPVTPVYGCTISLSRNGFLEENRPRSQETNVREQREHEDANSDHPQYGMSVLLKNTGEETVKNFQGVVTLPVGLQISLKGTETEGECSNSERNNKIVVNSVTLSRGNSPPEQSRQEDCWAQNNVSTQIPSSRRPSQTSPSTAAQTNYTSRKCDQCRRRNSYCFCLSDRSSPGNSQSSRMTERRESLKCDNHNDELVDIHKTRSSLENDSPPKSPIRMKLDYTEESSGHRCCGHKTQDCRKHLEQGRSPPNKYQSKGAFINPCYSNAASQYEKSMPEFRSCHCSKVQVQKYSTCSCQIIKIMGPQCLRDIIPRSLRKQATENQSSQTDEVTVVTKDLIKSPVIVKPTKAMEVQCPSLSKIAIEKKTAIVEKQPVISKVALEKRHSLDKKIEVKEKVAMLRRLPEVQTPVKEKHLIPHFEQPEQNSSIYEKVEKITKALQEGWTCTCYEAYQKETSKDHRRSEFINKEPIRDRLNSFQEESCEEESFPIRTPQEDDYFKSRRNSRFSGQEMAGKKPTSQEEPFVKEPCSAAASHNYYQEPLGKRNIRYNDQKMYKKQASFQEELCDKDLSRRTDYDHYLEKRRGNGQEILKKRDSFQEMCEEESSSMATPQDYYHEVKRNSSCSGQEARKKEPTLFDEEVFNEEPLPMAAACDDEYYYERKNIRTNGQEMIKKRSVQEEKRKIEPSFQEAIKKKPTKDKDELNKDTPNYEDYDDHPRHYFLKIEETEVDDSNESLEPRKPVEVITVKVPVKKAGKGKIHKPERSSSYHTGQHSLKSETDTSKLCICCKNCKVYEQKSSDYCTSQEYGKSQAERPHSPMRINTPDITPVNSMGKMGSVRRDNNYRTYKEAFHPELAYERSTIFTPEHSHKKNGRIEYDSHKKSRKKGLQLVEKGENHRRPENIRIRNTHENEFELNDEDNGVPIAKHQRHYNMGGPRDDYYNYDKREYKTRSELLKEEMKRAKTYQTSLQESLFANRPDFYHNAERRRQVITEKARHRAEKQHHKTDFLMNLMHCINENNPSRNRVEKRLFTSAEMREQTMKRYKNLPETIGKITDRKKKAEHMTNRILADIYSKKLQIEALKGHINLSNSISVLATI